MLFFDSKRYLFNAGENLHRCMIESKVRLAKITDVFLTGTNTEAIAALPSLMLNLKSAHAENLKCTIHGPVGIAAFIESACTFQKFPNFQVIEYGSKNANSFISKLTTSRNFEDENIRVTVISSNSNDEK